MTQRHRLPTKATSWPSTLVFTASLLGLGLIGTIGCSKKETAQVQATVVDVTPGFIVESGTLQSDAVSTVTYEWKTGPSFQAPTAPLKALVHIVDEWDKIIFQDDHFPDPPVTTWEPGKTYTYTRRVYVEPVPGDLRVECLMGLYDPVDIKAPINLKQGQSSAHRVAAGTLTLLASPYPPPFYSDSAIRFQSGWFDRERSRPEGKTWRWIGKTAKAQMVNPGADSTLLLIGELPQSYHLDPTGFSVLLNGEEIYQLTPEGSDFFVEVPVSAEQLGSEEEVDVNFVVEETFVPAVVEGSADKRELGLRFYKIMLYEGLPDGAAASEERGETSEASEES